MAREQGCNCVTVRADEHAMGFYRKQGFEEGLVLQLFEVATEPACLAAGLRFEPTTLSRLPAPRGGDLRTARQVHPEQVWQDLRAAEAHPPLWKGTSERRKVIHPYLVDVPGTEGQGLAVYRLAYWAADPGRAVLYLWSHALDCTALRSAVGHARKLGIHTLSVPGYGQVAEWLRSIGAVQKAREQVLLMGVGGVG
jgi:hypothetical protein